MPVPKDVVDKLVAELTPDELEEVCKLLGIMTIAPQPPATLTPKTETPVAPQPPTLPTPKKKAPGESTIKKETRGEWTIKILTLFKADASDISNTAILVLDFGLVTLSTVKLLKKNVDVLRKMVRHVGAEFEGMANDKQKELKKKGDKLGKKLASEDTMKGFLVYELIRYKRRLSSNAKNDAKKMAQAA